MEARVAMALITAVFSSFAAAQNKPGGDTNELKYAISYCLSTTYPNTTFSSDARHVAGAYLDQGTYGIDTYESIRLSVDSHIAKAYVSKHERNLSIMRCLDLLDSDNLIPVPKK